MTNLFTRLLSEKPWLLADGATGTNLFAMGLMSGDSPELWNSDYPEKIKAHYQSFIEAGSDIVLTNTFGGTSYRLKLHNAQERVHELNVAGARLLADCVRDSGREVVVAGSMGPTGEILQPAGELDPALAEAAFAEQAMALKEGGVDVLWIETISSTEETQAAVKGASVAGLPIVITLSIDTNGRTMMGLTGEDLVQVQPKLHSQPVAFGTNCGLGASEVVAAVINMKTACEQAGVEPQIIAKANCGIPEWVDGEIRYNGTPELMAKFATMAVDSGAKIVGGCCGTTPGHIAEMRKALDEHERGEKPEVEHIVSILGDITAGAKAQLAGDTSVAGGAVGGAQRRSSRRRK